MLSFIKPELQMLPDVNPIGEFTEENINIGKILSLDPEIIIISVDEEDECIKIGILEQLRVNECASSIIAVTDSQSADQLLRNSVIQGVAGFLIVPEEASQIPQVLSIVANGGSYITPRLLRGYLTTLQNKSMNYNKSETLLKLTKREEEILSLLASGLSNSEIADYLVLGRETVKTHISSILNKLNLTDRTQAALFALQNGIVLNPIVV